MNKPPPGADHKTGQGINGLSSCAGTRHRRRGNRASNSVTAGATSPYSCLHRPCRSPNPKETRTSTGLTSPLAESSRPPSRCHFLRNLRQTLRLEENRAVGLPEVRVNSIGHHLLASVEWSRFPYSRIRFPRTSACKSRVSDSENRECLWCLHWLSSKHVPATRGKPPPTTVLAGSDKSCHCRCRAMPWCRLSGYYCCQEPPPSLATSSQGSCA